MRLSDVRALAAGIDHLAKWLRRQTPPPISLSTLSALDRLHTEGPLRISELAEREAMTQPGVTILVNRLAEAGYAERAADPTDRRAALVRITDAGRALLAARHAARAETLRHRIAALSDEDQALLAAALPAIQRLVPTSTPNPARKNQHA
jgi:DNA-binding MarR family transcriptional regulator